MLVSWGNDGRWISLKTTYTLVRTAALGTHREAMASLGPFRRSFKCSKFLGRQKLLSFICEKPLESHSPGFKFQHTLPDTWVPLSTNWKLNASLSLRRVFSEVILLKASLGLCKGFPFILFVIWEAILEIKCLQAFPKKGVHQKPDRRDCEPGLDSFYQAACSLKSQTTEAQQEF